MLQKASAPMAWLGRTDPATLAMIRFIGAALSARATCRLSIMDAPEVAWRTVMSTSSSTI